MGRCFEEDYQTGIMIALIERHLLEAKQNTLPHSIGLLITFCVKKHNRVEASVIDYTCNAYI